MQYSRNRSTGYYSSYFPPGVKWLLISNIAIFLLEFFARLFLEIDPFRGFGLVPVQVLGGYFWQVVTYLFLHGSITHILFNMLALWMFGADLERDWGTRRFLRYYFLCGVGAAMCVIFAATFLAGPQEPYVRTIGASGAIYGILLAFGLLYPDRIVLYGFLFPMKAKYFVLITGAIVFLSSLQPGGRVSHVAHLGGMLFGYLFLKLRFKRRRTAAPAVRLSLLERYRKWKLDRARRKFQVYMRKHGPGRDPWLQ